IATTGHSLGGHLAAAFTRLFPELEAQALTVDGAGFATGSISGLGGNAALNIPNLFGMLFGAPTFDASRIVNVYGEKGPELVTQNGPGLFQQGTHLPVFIESWGIGQTLGHGSAQMTDSMAI